MPTYVVRNLTFELGGGVVIDFMDRDCDIKTNRLAISHALQIPPAPEYEQGLEELMEVVQRVLVDAIEDLTIVDSVPLETERESESDDD